VNDISWAANPPLKTKLKIKNLIEASTCSNTQKQEGNRLNENVQENTN